MISDIVWTVATYNLTATLSLNEAVRLVAGVVGIMLHLSLLGQSMHRRAVLMGEGVNGVYDHVAVTRIGNEVFGITLQLLMIAPAVVVMQQVTSITVSTPTGVAIVWSQAAVSVILTMWAWWRFQRGGRLDELLAEKEMR